MVANLTGVCGRRSEREYQKNSSSNEPHVFYPKSFDVILASEFSKRGIDAKYDGGYRHVTGFGMKAAAGLPHLGLGIAGRKQVGGAARSLRLASTTATGKLWLLELDGLLT